MNRIPLALAVALLAACSRPEPVPPTAAPRPPMPPQLVSHATSDHSCALDGYGVVSCWGRNDAGQLGDADTSVHRARVAPGTRLDMVAVGGRHTCALDANGVALCWGANASGQLGVGDSTSRAVPTSVHTERRFARIAAGTAHTCALDRTGLAFCWGDNRSGQLGNGTRASSPVPVAVSGEHRFLRLTAGSRHTCGVTTENRPFCWGDNFLGQLGRPRATQNALEPVGVPGVDSVTSLSAGHGHTCAVTFEGAGWCWGQNGIGQLGSGAPPGSSPPVRIAQTPPLVELRAGYHHTCAVDTDGTAWCWGANTTSEPGNATISGQLGNDASWSNLPLRVTLDQTVASVAPGDGHTCVMTRPAAVVYCFGSNRYGQLGSTAVPRSLAPVRVLRAEPDPEAVRP